MSKKGEETPARARTPRETVSLYGHRDAEASLLDAYRGGQCPHAWLIGGPHGIGKATLAFRFARFVLAHPSLRAFRAGAHRRLRSTLRIRPPATLPPARMAGSSCSSAR